MPRSSASRSRHDLLALRASHMRRAPTTSEARLFEALRRAALGVWFRRHVPLLGRFIADLLAPDVRLVVEIDGLYHTRREAPDAHRDRTFQRAGYTVVRIDAQPVMLDLDAAGAILRAEVARLRCEP